MKITFSVFILNAEDTINTISPMYVGIVTGYESNTHLAVYVYFKLIACPVFVAIIDHNILLQIITKLLRC